MTVEVDDYGGVETMGVELVGLKGEWECFQCVRRYSMSGWGWNCFNISLDSFDRGGVLLVYTPGEASIYMCTLY